MELQRMLSSRSDAPFTENLAFRSIEEFAEAVGTLTVPWQIGSTTPNFEGRMRRRSFEKCLFGEMRYGACTGVRDNKEIALSDQPYICLSLYTQGLLDFVQDGSTWRIGSNELLLWDGSKPSLFECLEPTRCELIWIPTAMVERRIGSVADYLGQKASIKESSARLLAYHARMLHKTIGDLPDSARASVLGASIDLIFSCFRPADAKLKFTPRIVELLTEAKMEIARRVEWGELRPPDVARALGISLRYLHKIFAVSGTTFSAYVTGKRLERARVALAESGLRQQTLTEIAHRFGFYDLSHFNRAFSQRYGVRPGAYRAQF